MNGTVDGDEMRVFGDEPLHTGLAPVSGAIVEDPKHPPCVTIGKTPHDTRGRLYAFANNKLIAFSRLCRIGKSDDAFPRLLARYWRRAPTSSGKSTRP